MGFYSGSPEPELGFPDGLSTSYPTLSHEKSALDVKISKRTDDLEPSLVLSNAPITDMTKTKDLFNDQEWMLAFGAHL